MFRKLLHLIPSLSLVGCAGCTGEEEADAVVSLLNENNYEWSGGLNIPSYETAELVDIHFDWSGLDKDMLCHDMDPVADIDSAGLTRFPFLTETEVAEGLTNNSLLQSDTSGYVSCEPGDRTECWLSEFSFGGTPYDTINVYKEDGGTFLFNLQTGTEPGQGARFVAFLQPRATSDVTELFFTPNCEVAQMEVEFEALTPVELSMDGPWTIEWSKLSIAGNGLPVIPGDLDEVMVASYDGYELSDLEAQFIDLDLIATDLYTLQLDGGTEATLSGLVNAEGEAFPGFTTDQTWLLALRCTSCTNPAPVFMSVVKVVE
ncbi:MAG: hypothetical protein FJ102_16695 [Deltaproteobacteria bacterium]|nr:hypothetical protein [Deltaproteobacteria bacterium]